MCGIFGVVLNPQAGYDRDQAQTLMSLLFRFSESRGKEAAGVAFHTPETVYLAKYPLAASRFVKQAEYRQLYDHLVAGNGAASEPAFSICIIGHSRLVTNGSHQVHTNNQPAVAGNIVGIHNGIITNADMLWANHPDLKRHTELDTEILLSLIRHYYDHSGSLVHGIRGAYGEIEGVASVAAFLSDLNGLLLATNNGSLYLSSAPDKTAYIFASEKHILEKVHRQSQVARWLPDVSIQQIHADTGILIRLDDLRAAEFSLSPSADDISLAVPVLKTPRPVNDLSSSSARQAKPAAISGEGPYVLPPSFVDQYPRYHDAIAQIRRCTRCILPETMPFITFDDEGVCNYCRHYTPIPHLGLDALRDALAPYRRTDGRPDSLVTLSGGRDSSYTLHLIKAVLGMNPITYTYDWGMVTDLARRNQMRMCGKLNVEHILVSANIRRKRANIRRNVLAWLQAPDLGMVPLFMAGDKQYFYYTNLVAA
ncbi:MAG: hypothetical protein GYB65_05800, partial [Chloroflexi bacterium]|nr:hypothetical protein [Chloroflexota bacterium]